MIPYIKKGPPSFLPSNHPIKLKDIGDFVYPLGKMKGHFRRLSNLCPNMGLLDFISTSRGRMAQSGR